MAHNFHRQLNGLQFVPQNTIAPTVLGEVRYNSATNKLELFDGVLDPIVTESGGGTLSNKILVGNTVGASSTNNIANSLLVVELASTPSTNPPAGVLALYSKVDGQFYILNSSGLETSLIANSPPITDSTILSNISGSSAPAVGNSLSAVLDHDLASTQGDIIYRNATVWTVLPPGSAGQVLSTGGAAANPSWIAAGGTGTVTSVATGTGLSGGPITTSGTISLANTAVTPNTYSLASITVNQQGQITAASSGSIPSTTPTVISQTSTLNPAAINTIYLCSGPSFIITLPTAVGINGDSITFKDVNAIRPPFIDRYVLNTTAGQTIDAYTSGQFSLATNQEILTVVSDGANWQIFEHSTAMPMVTVPTITLNTGAFGTTTIKEWRLHREGSFLVGQLIVNQTGAGTSGSGEYHITLPTGLAIDTLIAPANTSSNAFTGISTSSLPSTCNVLVNTGSLPQLIGQLCVYDTTTVRMIGQYFNNGTAISSASSEVWVATSAALGNTTLGLMFSFRIPISGWKP
jgi:hypothetical protein